MRKYAIVFCLLISSCAFAQTEIGLQLYSLRNEIPKDLEGTLAKINKWGIRQLEGGGTSGLPLAEYKALLKKYNLEVVSVGADFNELKDSIQNVIKRAKSFDARYVVCFWVPHPGNDFTLANIQEAVNVFSAAGKALHEQGISLCYHPHGYEFRPHGSGTLFDYLVENTDARYLNFEMDVFWVKHPGQDPVALLKKYPKRFVMMHLKDRRHGTEGNQNGNADVETNVVLGTGDVGIAAIMKEAKKIGVKYYFIEDESSRAAEQIPQSLVFLRSLDRK